VRRQRGVAAAEGDAGTIRCASEVDGYGGECGGGGALRRFEGDAGTKRCASEGNGYGGEHSGSDSCRGGEAAAMR